MPYDQTRGGSGAPYDATTGDGAMDYSVNRGEEDAGGTPPVNEGEPVISVNDDDFAVGGSASVSTAGTVTGVPDPTITWQWQRTLTGTSSWANITGETTTGYVFALGDIGYDLRIMRHATNGVSPDDDTPSDRVGPVIA